MTFAYCRFSTGIKPIGAAMHDHNPFRHTAFEAGLCQVPAGDHANRRKPLE
jgi:hypothetical protein